MNSDKNKLSINRLLISSQTARWVILILVVAVFAVILYPNLIIPRQTYKVGDIAERNIKAPFDFFIEDQPATEARRRQMIDTQMTVYDHNTALAGKISRQVNQAFEDMRIAIEQASTPPEEDAEVQEEAAQASLVSEMIWAMKEEFESALGIPVEQDDYRVLAAESFSPEIDRLIIRILMEIMKNGVVSSKEILIKESDMGMILRDLSSKTETVVQNPRNFYGMDQVKTMVQAIGQPYLVGINQGLQKLIIDLTQNLIQPNITLNRSETEDRRKTAAAEVKPILYQIKAGEMLIREGERVTELQRLKLQTLQDRTRQEQVVLSSIGSVTIILCLLVIIYIMHLQNEPRFSRDPNRNLIFISTVLIAFVFLARISVGLSDALTQGTAIPFPARSLYYGIPMAAASMTVCLFLGLSIAVPFSMALSVCGAVLFQNKFEIFLYFLLSSTMAAYWIRDCRERKVFIGAGLRLGLLNLVLVTAINIYLAEVGSLKMLWDWAFAFLGGLGAGIVAAGLAPLLEIAFGYTTDITLLELANLDRPILRRLMIEAPGTYHHSMVIGSMVEAAASAIGANPILAKVCGYYHDIGKIKKPLYFVENQFDGINRHDKLAPSMSALILIAHVKNGVEIATENRLGRMIIDTIRQHHGTSLIRFFYEKAKKLKGDDSVKIDDFRYPGPKPQTKEAGLVMLADVVEAASRTLENPTPSRIQGQVQNLINKIFADGQLDDCELTLKDLHNIAQSFNKILNGIYHHRIEYAEPQTPANGKSKDGSTDRQPSKQSQNAPKEDTTDSQGHLKRLGVPRR